MSRLRVAPLGRTFWRAWKWEQQQKCNGDLWRHSEQREGRGEQSREREREKRARLSPVALSALPRMRLAGWSSEAAQSSSAQHPGIAHKNVRLVGRQSDDFWRQACAGHASELDEKSSLVEIGLGLGCCERREKREARSETREMRDESKSPSSVGLQSLQVAEKSSLRCERTFLSRATGESESDFQSKLVS